MVELLRKQVESVSKRSMKTPRDFDWLSERLSLMGERLSPTTLKRCWGYLNENVKTRKLTLDILSRYLGYKNFEHFSTSHLNGDEPTSDPFLGNWIRTTTDLEINDRVMLTWQPGRICIIRYLGSGQFVVENSERTRLQPGNTFFCYTIIEGEQLYLKDLIQNAQPIKNYVCGKHNGIHFRVLDKDKKENKE